MARVLLAICLSLATCSVANAQVYGALGYAPFGGYARTGSAMYGGFGSYYAPPVYYRPISYYDYRTRPYRRRTDFVNRRFW
jgi:hypothetical protein